jgi:hypothetical protein
MASVPTAAVATEATIGPDNPGTATTIDMFVDPNDDLDETLDATVPIVCPKIIDFIIKLCKFPEDLTGCVHQSAGLDGVDS